MPSDIFPPLNAPTGAASPESQAYRIVLGRKAVFRVSSLPHPSTSRYTRRTTLTLPGQWRRICRVVALGGCGLGVRRVGERPGSLRLLLLPLCLRTVSESSNLSGGFGRTCLELMADLQLCCSLAEARCRDARSGSDTCSQKS